MGFWKKLAKIGAIAAPFVAAPFTGGASLAMIGAGAGAVPGILDKNLKGALTGGALGAIPGIGKLAKGAKAGSTLAKVGSIASKAGKVNSVAGGIGQALAPDSGMSDFMNEHMGAASSGNFGGDFPSLEQLGGGGSTGQNLVQGGIDDVIKQSTTGMKPGGLTGFLQKMKSAGLDPTALGLGAMSLLGKDPNQRDSFKGSGPLTDPVSSLNMSQELALKLGKALSGSPVSLRQIPGLAPPPQDDMGKLLAGLFDGYGPNKPAEPPQTAVQRRKV